MEAMDETERRVCNPRRLARISLEIGMSAARTIVDRIDQHLIDTQPTDPWEHVKIDEQT